MSGLNVHRAVAFGLAWVLPLAAFRVGRNVAYAYDTLVYWLAERYKLPVITLIDTPGAYPGIDSEERGISESIAQNLAVMSRLATPIVCVVIGEGSSGGALGIGLVQFERLFLERERLLLK